jgi:hypothetical protein
VGLFGGPPKELKQLDRQLTAARLSFGMFERLPPQNQQRLLDVAPREVGGAARAAARAGHGPEARRMLDAAAQDLPAGSVVEQWRAVIAAGTAAVG